MRKQLFLLILLLINSNTIFSQTYTLFGTVKSETGETLISANVYVNATKAGTISNNYGFYSLQLSEGSYELIFSFIGYKTVYKKIVISKDTELNVELFELTSQLDEVVVNADKNESTVKSIEISRQSIDIKAIKALPAFAGETDIVKALQLLPGVQSSNQGTTNMSIRGGSYDQNLVLLDEAPIYNPAHALSFFSVFNPDAIKDVQLYKGIYPPNYGGRVSSVIDIKMKEGNNKKLAVSGGIGLIASRLTVEAPIIKNKASFIVSGRYSYAGHTVNLLGEVGGELGIQSLKKFQNKNELNFYDFNVKLNYKINSKNHIYLSMYSGQDHFYYYVLNDDNSMDWGNTTATFRWNKIYGAKLFSNLSVIFSQYDYSYIIKNDTRNFRWISDMQFYNLKYDFDYFLNDKHYFKFGTSLVFNTFSPGKIEPRDTSSITKPFGLDNKKAAELSLYISDKYKLNSTIGVDYGIRSTLFFNIGEASVYQYSQDMEVITDTVLYNSNEIVKSYHGFEPYLVFRFLLNSKASFKAGYSRKYQFQHLISNSTVGLPTDIWLPADSYIKPQKSDNYSIGYFQNFSDNNIEFSIETYYRNFFNVIDYKDNADLFLNPHIETQILSGTGKAYGIEFFIRRNTGRYKGFASYTLSKTTKKINGINNNETFSTPYDKRHNFSANINYKLNDKWSLSSVFSFISGGYATIPLGTFSHYGASFSYYSKRNEYEIPPYHSLDIALKYCKITKKTAEYEWIFSINNIYNRKNVFSLFIKQDDGDLSQTKAYKMYLFGIFPSVSFNFKF